MLERGNESDSELRAALEEAFPGSPWSSARVAAFKEAKRLCEEAYEEEAEMLPLEGESDEGLAAIFGPTAVR
jgi:hypothetical protein